MSQDLNPSTCSSLVIFMYWASNNPHFQCNASLEVAATFPRFCNEPHLLHTLFVKFVPGTTFTSWAKHHFVVIGKAEQQVRKAFHTVAPSNNEDPTSCSFYFCLFAQHGCCPSHTSRSWWIAHSTQY